MISAGELYDLADELRREGNLPGEKQAELIDECHRLSHLIGEMADFRSTKQHDEQMVELKRINETLHK